MMQSLTEEKMLVYFFERCDMKNELISVSPEVLSGTPVFRGTRVPVKNLFDYIETGETLEEFLTAFPTVSREQAVEVLNMAEQFLTSDEFLNENFA